MNDNGLPDLTGRVALVTGASRGIGYALALKIAAAGAHVIAVARTQGGLEELDDNIQAAGGQASLVPLDLTDMEAIDRLGGVINDRWGRLDILVANAGVLGPMGPIGQAKAKDFERVVDLNVRSVWRLIRSTDPLLRKSDAGRALIMSSKAAHFAKAYWGPYAMSKAAVEALARSWANETKQTKLTVNSVNPGATRTHMRAQAMPGEDATTLPTPETVAASIVHLCGPASTETGKIWNVREQSWQSYSNPE
ncbi:MAG: SDR family NAD(P)-dependent oxidoreductase [Pseudomonadota bacterium]